MTVEDLENARKKAESSGYTCKTYLLNKALPDHLPPGFNYIQVATVLVIKNGVKLLGVNPDEFYKEQNALDTDKKKFMRGRVVNARARYNLCFGEEEQKSDVENGKGTVVPFNKVPLLKNVRDNLQDIFGPKAANLWGEGNYYYDPENCYIGYHGYGERRYLLYASVTKIHYTISGTTETNLLEIVLPSTWNTETSTA